MGLIQLLPALKPNAEAPEVGGPLFVDGPHDVSDDKHAIRRFALSAEISSQQHLLSGKYPGIYAAGVPYIDSHPRSGNIHKLTGISFQFRPVQNRQF